MSTLFIIYVVGASATFSLVMATETVTMDRRIFLAFGYALIWPLALLFLMP